MSISTAVPNTYLDGSVGKGSTDLKPSNVQQSTHVHTCVKLINIQHHVLLANIVTNLSSYAAAQ